jgi:hypothetical protein
MSPMHYSKFHYVHASKSGVLFILCEHDTKAIIGDAKMANKRYAVNRNDLESYWTSDGLSLCSK